MTSVSKMGKGCTHTHAHTHMGVVVEVLTWTHGEGQTERRPREGIGGWRRQRPGAKGARLQGGVLQQPSTCLPHAALVFTLQLAL